MACGSLSLLVIWKLHAWPESSLETLLLRTHAWKPYRCNRCCFVCLDQPHDMFCSVLSWPWGDFNCSAASSFHMPLLRLEKREPHGRSTEHFCEKYWRILALCFGELSENSKTVVLVFRSYHTLVTVSTWLVHRSCAFYPPYVRSKHLQENKIWKYISLLWQHMMKWYAFSYSNCCVHPGLVNIGVYRDCANVFDLSLSMRYWVNQT